MEQSIRLTSKIGQHRADPMIGQQTDPTTNDTGGQTLDPVPRAAIAGMRPSTNRRKGGERGGERGVAAYRGCRRCREARRRADRRTSRGFQSAAVWGLGGSRGEGEPRGIGSLCGMGRVI